jgi:hypothetical protein
VTLGRARAPLVAVAVTSIILALTLVGPGRHNAAAAGPGAGITVTLTGLSPRHPDPAKRTQKVTFFATVTNNSAVSYPDFEVYLERGTPIVRQDALTDALGNPPETISLATAPLDIGKPLPAHASIAVVYSGTPDSQNSGMLNNLCLCDTGIYPFAVVAAVRQPDGTFSEVARTQVLIPSFLSKPAPVQVAWVWPLIDRPHRRSSDTQFIDDDLATSVSAGGRLDRALAAAELAAAAGIRLTLVIDPDLLDSLAVMTTGYTVRSGSGSAAAGTGGPLASLWLARLAAIRDRVDIQLTAFADPDVDAVTRAELVPNHELDRQVQDRIAKVLPIVPQSSLAWPANSVLTSAGLEATISAGATAVVVSDSALTGQKGIEPVPDALSPLPATSGQATALVTDTAMQATIAGMLKPTAAPAQGVQNLLAQLAVRAAQQPDQPHFVLLTPPRYVDAAPAVAAAMLTATVGAPWARSISVPQALATIKPVDRGPLQTAAAKTRDELNAATMRRLGTLTAHLASFREALVENTSAATLLGGFASGIERAESNGWRADRAGAEDAVRQLHADLAAATSRISLRRPTNGTYSLSSGTAPILVTVQNSLPSRVAVRLSVTSLRGVVGFRAADLGVLTIPANTVQTVSVPTQVDRVGRFVVVATLFTPDGTQLGDSVNLSVRGTSIGGISKIITFAAAAILVLALLRRAVRKLRRHRTTPRAAAAGTRAGVAEVASPVGAGPESRPGAPPAPGDGG